MRGVDGEIEREATQKKDVPGEEKDKVPVRLERICLLTKEAKLFIATLKKNKNQPDSMRHSVFLISEYRPI